MASVGMCPVRCYTCGKVIAPICDKYEKMILNGTPIGEALTKSGLEKSRECCRMHVLGSGVETCIPIQPLGTAGHIEFLKSKNQHNIFQCR